MEGEKIKMSDLPFGARLKTAWNVFLNKDPTHDYMDSGYGYSYRPDRPRLTRGNERSIVTSVYNRIALDVASITIQHVILDENDRFLSYVNSGLNTCLTLEANVDQTGRAFIQDVVMSMLDEGCVAVVPIDTDVNDNTPLGFDVESMRTGKILEWYPNMVKVKAYNERKGIKEDIVVPKSTTAIIENPLYSVINEPNSTMQRLIRKLNLLDAVDEQSGSGKLDLIIQLPFAIKSEARRAQAEKRRLDVETQLSNTKYGVAYTDGTERITQLNRPVNNNLMTQIEYLTSMLYSQLGISASVLDGTADEKTMLNYYSRTIEPIISAIVDEMKRSFLTKAARIQRHSIMFFKDPFRLVPLSELAEIADKFTRNEIMSSNEIREITGRKPSSDPKADELKNKNISSDANEEKPTVGNDDVDASGSDNGITESQYIQSIDDIDDMDAQINDLESIFLDDELTHYSSQYYDPVKAHEYYERTKQLRGRTSTARLNDAGKEAASYVKDRLTGERKNKVDNKRETTNAQINSEKERMQSKIDLLREKLKNMESGDKEKNKDAIKSEILGLRESNKMLREKLKTVFKTTKTSLKNEYDEKYVNELDKIKSNSSFLKTRKRK